MFDASEVDMLTPVAGAGKKVAVLTSGGDAPGMNAAVRAVTRTSLAAGAQVYAVYEGFQGMVDGGSGIRELSWDDLSGILQHGGTVIGTVRSDDFRERSGRLLAAKHLVQHGIDRLVVIGGDGSLTGLDTFATEWPHLLAELHDLGQVTAEQVKIHPKLMIAGLVGSIDNDLVGTDMTIGADSALHRIVDAIDAISSTAASHQRSFVVEVMGRHCGYLALMSAIAGGCDYTLIPEHPPADGWEDVMCTELRRGRDAGRRDSLVIVAEGAMDQSGQPITAEYVRSVIAEKLDEDTRVTILGHVQRGGTPSAFDRWCSTLLGYAAARQVLGASAETPGRVIGLRGNRLVSIDLMQAVRQTREVSVHVDARDYDQAMALRGGSFAEMRQVFVELSENPEAPASGKRVAVLHAGALAPGMNTAARAAVRLGLDRGHTMLGVGLSFDGLRDGRVSELLWRDVDGWSGLGGAELGSRRSVPETDELYAISRTLEREQIDALVVIGGLDAYQAVQLMFTERHRYPAFKIPVVAIPASIDNNVPGSELSIGADTALNAAVEAIDRIKQSASASQRCFVIETMGQHCGYLAMMSALGGGAEQVYIPEEGITLAQLQTDVDRMKVSFGSGRRVFLAVRAEQANPWYTTDVIARLFEAESDELFDVRTAVLGHLQQGGNPSPFDRLLATRLVAAAMTHLDTQMAAGRSDMVAIGLAGGQLGAVPIRQVMDDVDWERRRPVGQWWESLLPVFRTVAGAA